MRRLYAKLGRLAMVVLSLATAHRVMTARLIL
jgi:hypothetical protein